MRKQTNIILDALRWAVSAALLVVWSAASAQTPTMGGVSRGYYSDRIDINWTHSVNTDAFDIYMSTTYYLSDATIIASALNGATRSYVYSVPTQNRAKSLKFWVCVTGAGTSRCSGYNDGYTVSTPYNLVATDGSSSSVNITFSRGSYPPREISDGTDYGYEIRRNGAFLDYVINSNAYYNDHGAAPGSTYTYQVCARTFNASGSRVYLCSNTDTGYSPLTAPQSVTATDGTYTNQVNVSYNLNGNTSVDIWRGPTKIASSTTINPYPDTAGTQGTIYSYKACAAGTATCSATDNGHRMGPPTSVVASENVREKVALTWVAPVNATPGTTYDVYRYEGSTPTKIVSRIDAVTYDDVPANIGVSYGYRVCTIGPSGPETASESTGIHCSPMEYGSRQLLAPSNVAASDGTYSTKVELSWTAGDCATVDINRNSQSIASGVSGTTYTDISAASQPGYTFQYTVACAGTGSGASDTGYVMHPPSAISASDGTSAEHVRLTWTAGGVSTVDIYRDDVKLTSLSSGTEYLDTTAVPGTTYTYKVCSPAADQEACSQSDTGYRMGPPGNSLVSATDGTVTDAITISWTYAGPDVTSFEVMRSPTGRNEWTSVGVVTESAAIAAAKTAGGTSITVPETNIDPVTMYDFKIAAVNGAGSSESPPDTGYANFAPTSVSGQFIALPATGTAHTPTVTDPNHGDQWQISIEGQGTKGSAVLSGDATGIVYTPNPDVTGTDTVTVRATDQAGASVTGVIEITLDCPDPVILGIGVDASLQNLQGMVRLEACSQPAVVNVNLEILSGTSILSSANLPIAPVAGTGKLFSYARNIETLPDGNYQAKVTVVDALDQTVIDAYSFAIDTNATGAPGFTYKGGPVRGGVTIDSFGHLGVMP